MWAYSAAADQVADIYSKFIDDVDYPYSQKLSIGLNNKRLVVDFDESTANVNFITSTATSTASPIEDNFWLLLVVSF
jgi:hypothetical protein